MIALRRVIVAFLIVLDGAVPLINGAGNCCSDCIQCPGTYANCIRHSDLCNGVKDCQQGEDENTSFCKDYSSESIGCSHGQTVENCLHHRRYWSCKLWNDVCNSNCSVKLLTPICLAFKAGQLPDTLTPPPPPLPLVEEPKPEVDPATEANTNSLSEYLLAGNCSGTGFSNDSKCPMLYTDIAGVCLAALPFNLTWPGAHQVCQSIAGKLLEFEDGDLFSAAVQHLVKTDLSSDFWIGGLFDREKEAWAWSSGGGMMPSSTPYWTLKYNSTCQQRKSFNGLGSVPGCFHYQQAPLTFKAGRCAALPYRYLYYISDEPCFEQKRPLCITHYVQ